ncbi:fork head domain-containing protein, partial [Phakopsora pachyrhizi]
KPPYTYASLITQALAASADEDGKMLVSEMCEWMTGVYPFYGTKEKGSDWQSALRHNLNADKRFRRVERTPTDGGKGNFWTLKSEEWANFDGLELRRSK